VERISDESGGPPPPSIFAKAIATPPGLPWDQARAAEMEARRAAPLPMANLSLQLRRLEPWRFRQAGRYAAFYTRSDQVGTGFTGSTRLGSQLFTVDFQPPGEAAARAKRMSVATSLGAVFAIVAAWAIGSALTLHAHTAKELRHLGEETAQRLTRAQSLVTLKRQTVALAGIVDRGAPLSDVLADLGEASSARKADVQIESFHWRPTVYGVLVRGDGVPYPENLARRADRPLRPDLWIWAVARTPATSKPAPKDQR
jgi:hypothetical protein